MAELSGHDLAVRMAGLARSLAPPPPVGRVLAEVTAAAVELIPGADTSGVLLTRKGGQFESLVGTGDLVAELDKRQAEFGSGPCISAATGELIIRSDDFATETRWPDFTRAAIALGVHTSMSFRLYSDTRTAGALNVFGSLPNVFTSESEAFGLVLASHAAAAILAARHSQELESGLASRDSIGQAKGIIMERFAVDAIRAFDMLRQLSQTENVPLAVIAERVIETRGGSAKS